MTIALAKATALEKLTWWFIGAREVDPVGRMDRTKRGVGRRGFLLLLASAIVIVKAYAKLNKLIKDIGNLLSHK